MHRYTCIYIQGGMIKLSPRKDDMIPFPFNENQFSFFCCRSSTSWPVVYKSQEREEPSIMSESDTIFNERDRRCAAGQVMLSTDPSYDNRTIASTLKMQIRMVQCMRAQLNASDDPLEVVERKATSCHLTSSKSAWKSTPKCTWMCWRVSWSPGAIRWPVANPGCGRGLGAGLQVQRDPGLASEGVLRLCTLLSLTPLLPRPKPAGLLRSVIRREHHQHDLITAIRWVFAKLPPALVEKACSQFRIRIETVIEAESGYIE